MRRLGATASERVLFVGLIAFVGAISALPLVRLLVEGLAPGGHLDPGMLARVLGAPRTWLATERTLATALASTGIATILGTGFALLVGATDVRGKAALGFVFLLPLMIPSQVTAIAWINLLGPASPLLKTLGLAPAPGTPHPLYGFGGISGIMGLEHAPLVFLAVRAALAALPGDAIEAAQAAGAGRWHILRTIVLPMGLPALAAGAALAFVSAIGNFGTPALLGIPAGYSVLTVLIYQQLAGFGPQAISQVAVLSLLLAVLALGGIAAERWVGMRRDIGWARPRTRRLIPLRGAAPAFLVAAWSVLALVVAVPMAALLATALVSAYGLPLTPASITVENFHDILTHAATARAALDSLFLAGATAAIVAGVAVPLGYVVVWRDGALARALAIAVELPYALPGVVLALSAILVFLRPLPLLGVSLYGTLGIILVAYLARFLVLALRTTVAGYRQIHGSLEEAAAIAGAGLWHRVATVILPLAAPAVAAGALLVFLIALNELTVSALLWSAGHETLGVAVFSLEQGGDSTLAAALSVLVVLATVALMGLASLAARRLPEGVLPWQG